MIAVGIAFGVTESGRIDAAGRAQLRELWDRAYGARFDDDAADHAYGGVHVLACESDDRVVGHAGAVERRIKFGDKPWLTIGYVEAVAVDPLLQGTGVGRQLMQRLAVEMFRRWLVAMLSTGRAAPFYEALGWERWRGISYTRTAHGTVADDQHGGLMILRPDRSIVPDISVDVTCEDRPGASW